MSTLELEHLKHSSASGNNITLAADGSVTVDTTTLKVDATNNRVGIGTTSPGYPLQVNGSVDILNVKGSTGNAFVRFTDSDATADFSIGADDGSYAGSGSFILYDRSNGAYRLAVNSNGQVTKPNQPAFHAGLNAATGANGAYVGNYILHADTGNHFNASTGIFTAPVAGKYFFAAFFMTNNSASTIDFSIHVNDVDYHYMVPYQASGSLPNYNQASGQCIVALSANDTVRIRNNNTALYGSSGNGRHSGFCGFLIG